MGWARAILLAAVAAPASARCRRPVDAGRRSPYRRRSQSGAETARPTPPARRTSSTPATWPPTATWRRNGGARPARRSGSTSIWARVRRSRRSSCVGTASTPMRTSSRFRPMPARRRQTGFVENWTRRTSNRRRARRRRGDPAAGAGQGPLCPACSASSRASTTVSRPTSTIFRSASSRSTARAVRCRPCGRFHRRPTTERGTSRAAGSSISESFVPDDAAKVSTCGYDDSRWLPATVPGTVLTSYLNAGAVPDMFYGDQQFQVSDWFCRSRLVVSDRVGTAARLSRQAGMAELRRHQLQGRHFRERPGRGQDRRRLHPRPVRRDRQGGRRPEELRRRADPHHAERAGAGRQAAGPDASGPTASRPTHPRSSNRPNGTGCPRSATGTSASGTASSSAPAAT